MNPVSDESYWASRRQQMVERQLKARGIRDPGVLRAMGDIPRERFVPEANQFLAYADEPVMIGYGQTISQPYMTALMVECLELTGKETVLEVGAGSGYHAAVIGALAAQVYTIEIIPELAEMARANLKSAGLAANIVVVCGDGTGGLPDHAPYDAISAAAAAPEVPPALLEQLRDPGRLVIPVGTIWDQELLVIKKSGGKVTSRVATFCRFVPLRGSGGWE
ncbi:MAG: protein-L-isoaspartate(D-aspartate) O-methyltransferase [Bryobacteraceae bacterium]